MSNYIDFSSLTPLFEAGGEFALTEHQYNKQFGRPLPKDTSYLKRKSAMARKAKEFGYKIEVVERTITFKKN